MRSRAGLLAAVLLVSSTWPVSPAVPAASPSPQASPAPDAGLTAGINLVRDGDFDGAILLLDAAARRLQPDRTRQKEAARAYAYLGVAYLELDQELVARGKFEAALALDPQMRLDPREFSPQQIRVFDSVRPAGTSATGPGPVPSPSPSPGDKKMAAAVPPEKKKKKSIVPWLLVGGAVVGGGAALAGGGGGGGGTTTTAPSTVGGITSTTDTTATTTTTTVPPNTNPGETTTTTTPTTTVPPSTTLGPGTTTTTTLPPTTTTPTTTTSTTTSTTTTTLPACSYSVNGPNPPTFGVTGGPGTCDVSTQSGCAWTATTNANWINFQTPTGQGNGTVRFTVGLNGTLQARQADIVLLQGSQPSCHITQAALRPADDAAQPSSLTSTLDLDGGEGQVVVDGSTATFQRRGAREAALPEGRALHRVEAIVVNASGRAGTWSFQLAAGVAQGTLRIVAGKGSLAGDAGVVFQLSGKPGERVVFAFRSR